MMYPDVIVAEDKIMTETDGLYTSGGAYSALNLLILLIEKHAGREMAVRNSKTFIIDMERPSQSPFVIFQGQREHGDDAIKAVQN